MKKTNIFSLLFLMLLPLLAGCSKDEIIFDSELPRFDLRSGYQLLEVIVPQGTLASDKLYIVGEFNGGADAAIGDPRWQLEKASDTDVKWGIYLNPADFVNGKTLANGYSFYSVKQGEERTLQNTPAIHTENPAVGQRENVIVYRWAEYFNKPSNPDEIEHDGYVIYVVDNTEYDNLALYAWGDGIPEIFGEWPGMKPTGKVEIKGVTYKYFDTGAANAGLNINLIFNNNNNGKQLKEYNVTLDKDYYLEATPDGVKDFDPSTSVVTHDGFALFVADNSGWDELWLYMWGSVNDLNGAWPGMKPTGTQTINGVTYTYFDFGAANCDKDYEQHLILNNGGNGKQVDDVVVFGLDRDVYIEFDGKRGVEIDPETYVPGGTVTPEPEPEPGQEYKIYVQDQTGWDNLNVYAWGDIEAFGGWPGKLLDFTETIGGVTFKVVTINGSGESINLIFNNGNGIQLPDYNITLDKDYYLIATADGVVATDRPADTVIPDNNLYKIYVEDKTGWDNLYVYAWGDAEFFGGWPGKLLDTTETVDGVTYKVVTFKGNGEAENLIFNNGNGIQLQDLPVTLDKNYYISADADAAVIK